MNFSSFPRYWKANLASYVWISIPLIVAFLNFKKFAYQDDYMQIMWALWNPVSWFDNAMTAEGRPLYGIILLAGWKWLQTVENAIWFRLFGVLGVFVTTILLCGFDRFHTRSSRFSSGLCAVSMMLTPGMAVYTFWATAAPYSWSSAIGVISGWISIVAWTDSRWCKRKILLSTLLALIAEMIYQPTAGFFLLPGFILVLRKGGRENLRRAVFSFIHFCVVLMIYLVLFKISSGIFFEGNERAARGGDLSCFLDNFQFYTTKLVPFASSSWGAFWGESWVFAIQILTLFAFVIWMVNQYRRHGLFLGSIGIGYLISALIAAGAPLIGSGTWAPYRTLSVTMAMLTLIVVVGFSQLFPRYRVIRSAGGLVGILLLAVITRFIVGKMVIDRQSEEYSRISAYIEQEFDWVPSAITVIQPRSPVEHIDGLNQIYEYGQYSTNVDWLVRSVFPVLLAEQLNLEPTTEVAENFPETIMIDVIGFDSGQSWYHGRLLDLPVIMGQECITSIQSDSEASLEAIELDVLGSVKKAPSGWIKHPWMGWFSPGPDRWIFHEEIGWLYWWPLDGDGVGIVIPEVGNFYGRLEEWPVFSDFATAEPGDIVEAGGLAQLNRIVRDRDNSNTLE